MAKRPAVQAATPATAKPAAIHRSGVLSAAIFVQQAKAEGGRNAVLANVSLRRSYQDAAGQWQQTTTLRRQDLLTAAYLLTKCFESLGDLDRRTGDEGPEAGSEA